MIEASPEPIRTGVYVFAVIVIFGWAMFLSVLWEFYWEDRP